MSSKDDILNPADMEPFQSAMGVVRATSHLFYKNQTPFMAEHCVQTLDYWQRNATLAIMADLEATAEPHTPYHDAYMESFKTGMKVVRRLRAQIFFFICGGKGTWSPTWSEQCN